MAGEDILRLLSTLRRVDDVLELVGVRSGRLGYTVFALGAPPRGDDFPGYFHSTWSQEWIDLYIREGFIADDPLPPAAAINSMPFLWSDLIAGRAGIQLTEAQLRVPRRAVDYGYLEGLCVPIHGPGAYLVLGSYGGRDPDTSLGAVSELHMLTLHAHVRLSALSQQRSVVVGTNGEERITAREIEALTCVLAGLTDAGIAQKLGVSERTARFHIDNARRKLGAKTRGQAVATALSMGLLSA